MRRDDEGWCVLPLAKVGFSRPLILKFADAACSMIRDAIQDPARREAAARQAADDVRKLFRDERARASERAADKGVALVRFRKAHGRGCYQQILQEAGVSPRTANNLICLAFFRWRAPRLFERLACLGPTKLYRLAVLDDSRMGGLDPDSVFTFDNRQTCLRTMTDRELIIYLRERFPVATRPRWPRVRVAALAVRRMLENFPPAEPVDSAELLIVRDAAQSVVNRLTARITQAS